MSTAKTVQALITFFCKEHLAIRGTPIVVNRFASKWGVQDVLSDISEDRLKELMSFFFRTNRSKYDISSFLSVYDQLDKSLKDRDKDAAIRAELRERTRLKVESLGKEDSG